jgi:iron(III) transport system permease protein
MQSAAGRGPGAALGVLAVLLVAAGTYVSHRLIAGRGTRGERAGIAKAPEMQAIGA